MVSMRLEFKLEMIYIGYFCFFDEGKLIILLNAFQKKNQKTPKDELKRAKRLRTQYYEDKATKKH